MPENEIKLDEITDAMASALRKGVEKVIAPVYGEIKELHIKYTATAITIEAKAVLNFKSSESPEFFVPAKTREEATVTIELGGKFNVVISKEGE